MTRAQLRLLHKLGQPAMDRAAPSVTRVGVHTCGKQRMSESHAVAVQPDDALGFGLVEKLDDMLGGRVSGRRKQLNRRCCSGGGGKQYGGDIIAEARGPTATQG